MFSKTTKEQCIEHRFEISQPLLKHQPETYVYWKDPMIKVKLLHPIYIQVAGTNILELFLESWAYIHVQQVENRRTHSLEAICGHVSKYYKK